MIFSRGRKRNDLPTGKEGPANTPTDLSFNPAGALWGSVEIYFQK